MVVGHIRGALHFVAKGQPPVADKILLKGDKPMAGKPLPGGGVRGGNNGSTHGPKPPRPPQRPHN